MWHWQMASHTHTLTPAGEQYTIPYLPVEGCGLQSSRTPLAQRTCRFFRFVIPVLLQYIRREKTSEFRLFTVLCAYRPILGLGYNGRRTVVRQSNSPTANMSLK